MTRITRSISQPRAYLSLYTLFYFTSTSLTESWLNQVTATMLSPVVPPRLTDDDSGSTNSTNLTPSMSTMSLGTSTPGSTFGSQTPLSLTPSLRGGSLVPYGSAAPQPLTTMQGYHQQQQSYFPQYQSAVPIMQTMQYVQVPQYQPGFATTPILHPQQGLPGVMTTQMQTAPLPIAVQPAMPVFQQTAYHSRPAARSEQMPTLNKWSAGSDCEFGIFQ